VNARIWGVAELIGEVNAALAGFGEVWVRGELSGVKIAASGHRYFQVKDAQANLSCAMWARSADRLRFKLTDGLAVLLRGRLEVYPQRGALQLIVEGVVPEGVGELQLAFEQLKAKLAADGLFAPERKRPLPALPQRLGLVTSSSGAAVRDVLKVLSRYRRLQVLLYPVRVQGRGAEGEIARAVRWLGASRRVDVVLVVRGGGSLEDLWAFNEEIVARAIAACPVPVISGVGHETDTTITDFVADLRAARPPGGRDRARATRGAGPASERGGNGGRRGDRAPPGRSRPAVAGSRGARPGPLPLRLRELNERLQRLALPPLLRAAVVARHRRLDAAAARLFHWPVRFGAPRRRELVTARIAIAGERLRALLRRRSVQVAGLDRALGALSPVAVLERGYSITIRERTGAPLRDSASVTAGERLLTRLARGTVRSLVVDRAGGGQGTLFEEEGSQQSKVKTRKSRVKSRESRVESQRQRQGS
jgi:exodeoxyribonuclease VII large subunit